jgi:hypothetical protein
MEMLNFYDKKEVKKYVSKTDNPNYDLHHFDIPYRALCIAPSGSGKSNFICNLISLFCKGRGTYDEIHIFCKSKDEPLYRFLCDKSKGLIEVHEDLLKLKPINEYKPHEQTLLIFDDMINDLKSFPVISEIYTSGRKRGISTMFLSQSFYATPKIIRQNLNYCIILKLGGSRDVNALLREISIGLTKEELMYMYNDATKEKFNCLIVNLEKSGNERYRKNFLDYYTIE